MRGRGRGSNEVWNWDRMSETCMRLARRYDASVDAEDVAQEALIRAWRFRDSVRCEDRVDGWLRTIVRNEAARQHAHPRPEPIPELDFTIGEEDAHLAAIADTGDLSCALDELDTDERMLLELRYGRDLTQPAIAKALELPEGTVKVRLHRARAKLRQALK